MIIFILLSESRMIAIYVASYARNDMFGPGVPGVLKHHFGIKVIVKEVIIFYSLKALPIPTQTDIPVLCTYCVWLQ